MLVPVCKILDFIEFCLNYQLHQKAVPQKSGVFKKKLMGSQNHHPKHATESDFCLKHDHNQFKTASNNDNTPKKRIFKQIGVFCRLHASKSLISFGEYFVRFFFLLFVSIYFILFLFGVYFVALSSSFVRRSLTIRDRFVAISWVRK